MNKYEKLKQIIQQANPEIILPVFGCVVSHNGTKGIIIERAGENEDNNWSVYWKWGNSKISTYSIYDLKILGRPITLSDVLLAIKAYKIKLDFDTRSQPFLFITDWNDKTVIWDLTKSYDDQSQEIKDFLVGLLVKE